MASLIGSDTMWNLNLALKKKREREKIQIWTIKVHIHSQYLYLARVLDAQEDIFFCEYLWHQGYPCDIF